MKFKLLKILNIRKTVAVATSFCFLFTMVFSQTLSAAFTPAPIPTVNQGAFKSIDDYLLPFSIGRITDALYTGSDEIVINIQDLHSHAQAQRNISNILEILDKKYGLKNVYVEGGIGQVDTSWLSSISNQELKEAILNNMLESGRLTGGEYYSVEKNKNKLLLGIEDKTTYINNLKRLNEFYSKKQEITKYVSFLKYTLNKISDKYYSKDNLKLNKMILKYKDGDISSEKYFTYLLETAQKANINLKKYQSIIAFLQVLKKQDGLDTKKVNLAIAELLNELKTQLPYEQYQTLLSKVSDKNKETEFYFDLYKVAKEKGLLEKSDNKTLLVFFEYLSLNQSLNPVNLTLDEKNLLQELNIKLSETQNEKDIFFLQSYMEYLSGYLTNKLTADDYEYFINNMAKFRLLWKKYVDINGIIEIDSYFNLFNDFYKDNVKRNRFFIKNIMGKMPDNPKAGLRVKANIAHAQKILDKLSKTKNVKVVITGGFHTYGFTKLLQDNNINYIVITPNVKKQTVDADVLYENVFKQQVAALYNTLQKMLVSQTGSDGILNSDVIEALDSTKLTEQAVSILNKCLKENGQNITVTKLEPTENGVNVTLSNGKTETIVLKPETERTEEEKELSNQLEQQNKADFKAFDKITDLSRQIRNINRKIATSDNKKEELQKLQKVVADLRKTIKQIGKDSVLREYAEQFENMDNIFNKENIVLIGPSGSGKSTTAKLVANTVSSEIISFDDLIDEYLEENTKLKVGSEEYKNEFKKIKNGSGNEVIGLLNNKIKEAESKHKVFVDGFGRNEAQINTLKNILGTDNTVFVYIERSGEDALEIGRQKQEEAGHPSIIPVEDERQHWDNNKNSVLNKLENDKDTDFVHITKDNLIPSSLIASFAVQQQAETGLVTDDSKMLSAKYLTQKQLNKLNYDTKLVNKFIDNPGSLSVDEQEYFKNEIQKAQNAVKFGTAGHRELIVNSKGEETFNPFIVFVLTDAYAKYINDDKNLPKRMFVGYDTRYMGNEYANIAAKTFAKYGIEVDMPNDYLATPSISNQVKNNGKKYAGSVNITASHNPGNYNGYKVNGPLGDPYGSEVTNKISNIAKSKSEFTMSAIKQRMEQTKQGKVNEIDVNTFRKSHVNNVLTIIKNMLGKKDISLTEGTNIILDSNHSALEPEMKNIFTELKGKLNDVLNSGKDVIFEKQGKDKGKSPEPNEANSEQLKIELQNNVNKELKANEKSIRDIELTNYAITTDPDGDRFGMYYVQYDTVKRKFDVKFASPDEIGSVVQYILLENLKKRMTDAAENKNLNEAWLKGNGFPLGLIKSADTTDQFNNLAEKYETEFKAILKKAGLSQKNIEKYSDIKVASVDIGYKNLADTAKQMFKNDITPVILLESSGGLVAGLSNENNTGTYDKDGLVANILPIVLLQNEGLTFAQALKNVEEQTNKVELLGRDAVVFEDDKKLSAEDKKQNFLNVFDVSADKDSYKESFSKIPEISKFMQDNNCEIESVSYDTTIVNGCEIVFKDKKNKEIKYSLIIRASGTEPKIRVYTKIVKPVNDTTSKLTNGNFVSFGKTLIENSGMGKYEQNVTERTVQEKQPITKESKEITSIVNKLTDYSSKTTNEKNRKLLNDSARSEKLIREVSVGRNNKLQLDFSRTELDDNALELCNSLYDNLGISEKLANVDIDEEVKRLFFAIYVYYHKIKGINILSVLPYDNNSAYIPQSAATLLSEYMTVLGQPGTNGQHSFYQLLHQGTVPSLNLFFGFANSTDEVMANPDKKTAHFKLLSNMIAQADAFFIGRNEKETAAIEKNKNLQAHKLFQGNTPSVVMMFENNSPLLKNEVGNILSAIAEIAKAVENEDALNVKTDKSVKGTYKGFTATDKFDKEIQKEKSADNKETIKITNSKLTLKSNIRTSLVNKYIELFKERNIFKKLNDIFTGVKVNATEGRAVLHSALRNVEFKDGVFSSKSSVYVDKKGQMPKVVQTLNKMAKFSNDVINGNWKGATGKEITHVVSIGIGGSDLGPRGVTNILADSKLKNSPEVRYVSNVDPQDLNKQLEGLKPETTLFIIESKTFTTDETMTNARAARKWLVDELGNDAVKNHFVAVSTAKEEVSKFGIDTNNMFEFWDWVGGRFSVWSAIGLPVMLSIGAENFAEFLQGANNTDEALKKVINGSADADENISVISAISYIDRINHLGKQEQFINAPFDFFVDFIQQQSMESLGKFVTTDGKKVAYNTGNVIVPSVSKKDGGINVTVGQSSNNKYSSDDITSYIDMEDLSPEALGELFATFEHVVEISAALWDINAFDQWGVQLGKELMPGVLSAIEGEQTEQAKGKLNLSSQKNVSFISNAEITEIEEESEMFFSQKWSNIYTAIKESPILVPVSFIDYIERIITGNTIESKYIGKAGKWFLNRHENYRDGNEYTKAAMEQNFVLVRNNTVAYWAMTSVLFGLALVSSAKFSVASLLQGEPNTLFGVGVLALVNVLGTFFVNIESNVESNEEYNETQFDVKLAKDITRENKWVKNLDVFIKNDINKNGLRKIVRWGAILTRNFLISVLELPDALNIIFNPGKFLVKHNDYKIAAYMVVNSDDRLKTYNNGKEYDYENVTDVINYIQENLDNGTFSNQGVDEVAEEDLEQLQLLKEVFDSFVDDNNNFNQEEFDKAESAFYSKHEIKNETDALAKAEKIKSAMDRGVNIVGLGSFISFLAVTLVGFISIGTDIVSLHTLLWPIVNGILTGLASMLALHTGWNIFNPTAKLDTTEKFSDKEDAALDLGLFKDKFTGNYTLRSIFVGLIESAILVPITIPDTIQKVITGNLTNSDYVGIAGEIFLNAHEGYRRTLSDQKRRDMRRGLNRIENTTVIASIAVAIISFMAGTPLFFGSDIMAQNVINNVIFPSMSWVDSVLHTVIAAIASSSIAHAIWNITHKVAQLNLFGRQVKDYGINKSFDNIEKYIENNPNAENIESLKKIVSIRPNITNMYAALQGSDSKVTYELTKHGNGIYDYEQITVFLNGEYEQAIKKNYPAEIIEDVDNIYNLLANVEETHFLGIETIIKEYEKAKTVQNREFAKKAFDNMATSIDNRYNRISDKLKNNKADKLKDDLKYVLNQDDIEKFVHNSTMYKLIETETDFSVITDEINRAIEKYNNSKKDEDAKKELVDALNDSVDNIFFKLEENKIKLEGYKFEIIKALTTVYNDETASYIDRENARKDLERIRASFGEIKSETIVEEFNKFEDQIDHTPGVNILSLKWTPVVNVKGKNKPSRENRKSLEDNPKKMEETVEKFYKNFYEYDNGYGNFISEIVVPMYIDAQIKEELVNHEQALLKKRAQLVPMIQMIENKKVERYYDKAAKDAKKIAKQVSKGNKKNYSQEELTAMFEILDRGITYIDQNKLSTGKDRSKTLKEARDAIRQTIAFVTMQEIMLDEVSDEKLKKQINKAKTLEELDDIVAELFQTNQEVAEKIIARRVEKRSLIDINGEDLQGKTIGLVLDLNVPIVNGEISDYTRINSTLNTIKYLTDRGAKVVAMSHHGRPKGWDAEESLKIVADGLNERSKEILGYEFNVKFPETSATNYKDYLAKVQNNVKEMKDGEVLLLENLRFDGRYSAENKGEMAKDFIDKLGLDGVVFDAFGVSHRDNFIREMIQDVQDKEIGAVTGFLVEKELNEFANVENPNHPFVAILGGSKVSDKIGVIRNLLDKMEKGDTIVIGGAMAYTFLLEQGKPIGNSKIQYLEDKDGKDILDKDGNKIIDPEPLRLAREVLNNEKVKNGEVRILLPVDHIVSTGVDFGNQKVPEGAVVKNTEGLEIEDGFMGVDIGKDTVKEIQDVLKEVGEKDGTIVWNGPSGIFEIEEFSKGTFAVAESVAEATDNGAFSIIGGGDSVSAANKAEVYDRISHISTGGGASLNLLEGNPSPLIEVIQLKYQQQIDDIMDKVIANENEVKTKVEIMQEIMLDEISDKNLKEQINKAKTLEELENIVAELFQTNQEAAEKIIARLEVYKRSLLDINDESLKGKTIALVVDLNAPLNDTKTAVSEPARIEATLRTIKYLTDRGANIILLSHLDRPLDEKDIKKRYEDFNMQPIADKFKEFGIEVDFERAPTPEQNEDKGSYSKYLKDLNLSFSGKEGKVVLLDNLRFDERYADKKTKAKMAQQFIDELGLDGVVYDAFGVSHRDNFATDMIEILNEKSKKEVKQLGSFQGFLVKDEMDAYNDIVDNPNVPSTSLVIGGAKVKDKKDVIDNFLDKKAKVGSQLIIQGGMANLFIEAKSVLDGKDYKIGDSLTSRAGELVEFENENGKKIKVDKDIAYAISVIQKAEKKKVNLIIPMQVVAVPKDEFSFGAEEYKGKSIIVDFEKGDVVPNGWMIVDVAVKVKDSDGNDTETETYKQIKVAMENIQKVGGTIIMNGPAGVFETKPFNEGTNAVTNLIADVTTQANAETNKKAKSFAGGGDSVASIKQARAEDKFSHVSTGGGAVLNLLGGNKSAAIEVIPSIFEREIAEIKKQVEENKKQVGAKKQIQTLLEPAKQVSSDDKVVTAKGKKNFSDNETVSINIDNSSKQEIENFVYEIAEKLQQDNNWSDEGRKIFENYMFARIAQIIAERKGVSVDEGINFNTFTPTAWQKEGVNFDGVIKNLDDLKSDEYISEAKKVDVGVYLMNGGIGSSIEREDYLVTINWYKDQIKEIEKLQKDSEKNKVKINEIENNITEIFNNELNIKDILDQKEYDKYKANVELAAKADDLYFQYKNENGNTRLISVTDLKNNSYVNQVESGRFNTLKETILVSPDSIKPVEASIASNPKIAQKLGLTTLMQDKYPVSRDNGDGTFEIFVGKNYPTAPGGHGVWFHTIWNQIINDKYDNGQISFVGNSDALAARPNANVVGYMEKENVGIVMLAAEREASDAKGGIFGLFKGRLTLAEIAQFEAVGEEDVFEKVGLVEGDDAQAFNTNSIYTNDKLLKELYDKLKEIGLTDSDIEEMMQPDLIVNGKEKDGIGKYDQLEGALGASVLNFNLNLEKLRKENKELNEWMNSKLGKGQQLVQVVQASKEDREEVFTPIKKAFDFWKQATNFVVVDGNKWISKSPDGHGTVNVSVKNSKGKAKQNYKDVSYFMDNWTNDDISTLDELSVDGYNVKLQNLKLEGEVIIENETDEEFVISKIEDLISRYNTTADALSVNFGISNILLKDFEYNKNADNLIRTGQVRKYLVLKNVKIVKKSDGIVIEKLRKEDFSPIKAATLQIESYLEYFVTLAVLIYSTIKPNSEIVAVVDIDDTKAINEAIELAKEGIKLKMILVGNKEDIINNEKLNKLLPTEETGKIVGDNDTDIAFELGEKHGKLTIEFYDSINKNITGIDTILNAQTEENVNSKKKTIYVSSSLIDNEQNQSILNSAVVDSVILDYSTESITNSIAKGLVAYKKKDVALNTVIEANTGMIASYNVDDEINYEAEQKTLNEQKLSRVMIRVTNENDIEKAKAKAEEFNKNGISDVMIVLVRGDDYEVISDETEKQIVENYETIKNLRVDAYKGLDNHIVYISGIGQDNLVLTADDMKVLIEAGATLAFDSDILNYMDAESTKENGITLLSVIKAILTNNSPEAKKNKAITKGRNLVVENRTGSLKSDDLIKAGKEFISDKQLENLGIKVNTSEEKEYIALGIIQALELQKVDAELTENLNKEMSDNLNELLTMLGKYKLLTGQSFADIGNVEIESLTGESLNDTLNRLRKEAKQEKPVAIAGIIEILLTDRLNISNEVENLTDNMDIKNISALLSAA